MMKRPDPEIHVQCVAEEVVEAQSPSEEDNMTIKRLRKQLKEAQVVIVQLREENKQMKRKIAEHLDLCEGALENNKRMVKRSLPLHRQVKNLYRQNKTLQEKDRLRKEQTAKKNLDLLAQVAVE
jgi:precorrin-2 methylase